MMRRVCPARPAFRAAATMRFGGGGGSQTFDHSASFSRPLTPDEQAALDAQKNRTVNKVVPGKVFMRHFIAAEQSTVSIENRVMSLILSGGIMLAFSVYSGVGLSTYNAALGFFFVFFMNFLVLHTHMNLYPAFAAIAVIMYATSG